MRAHLLLLASAGAAGAVRAPAMWAPSALSSSAPATRSAPSRSAGCAMSSLDLSRDLGHLFYVDEPSCVGCTRCAEIAGKTFAMEPDFGCARVVLQGGDDFEDIREAIRSCPSECIHQVTVGELAVLEQWRETHLDAVQRKHVTSRLVGASTPPPWWLPLKQASAGVGWHPIINEYGDETKATVDFMGSAGGAGAGALNIAMEDALELKHSLPPTAQVKSRADALRMLREHKEFVLLVAFVFALQGLEILNNQVYL